VEVWGGENNLKNIDAKITAWDIDLRDRVSVRARARWWMTYCVERCSGNSSFEGKARVHRALKGFEQLDKVLLSTRRRLGERREAIQRRIPGCLTPFGPLLDYQRREFGVMNPPIQFQCERRAFEKCRGKENASLFDDTAPAFSQRPPFTLKLNRPDSNPEFAPLVIEKRGPEWRKHPGIRRWIASRRSPIASGR